MTQRKTIQRALTLEAVQELQCHATAEEVYDLVAKKHPHISKGTIYRNLKLLSDSGEILKVENIESSERYDHNCHKHYHIQCVSCLRVFDVNMDYFYDLCDRVNDKQGFVFSSHSITFKGLCPECCEKNHIS